MYELRPEKTITYRQLKRMCNHTGPVIVNAVEGGRRAHCLVCGFLGPVRSTSEEARLALSDGLGQAVGPSRRRL